VVNPPKKGGPKGKPKMSQGVFSGWDLHEIDGEYHNYRNVVMERDIGPFRRGDTVLVACLNAKTGDLLLSSRGVRVIAKASDF